jgi:hypothetical protein
VVLAAIVLALALPSAASAAADGAIAGTVTEANGGLGVVDARVCAEAETGEFSFECTLTGSGGSYEVTGLPPAEYVVWFETGESGKDLVRQFWHGVSRFEEATMVTVASGMTTRSIDAALAEGGAIAGRATAVAGGAPLANIEVCSWSESDEAFDGCDITTGNGTYEIQGVAEGLHEVEFWDPEGEYEPAFRNGISVAVGATSGNVNAALTHTVPAEGRISGHVYAAANHNPLGNVAVCAIWAPTGESGGCAVTGTPGAYAFTGVPVGPWKVVFSPEPAEVEFNARAKTDAWPTQYWSSEPTLALANALAVGPASNLTGIDGLLGPGPAPPAPAPAPIVASKPKPLKCPKGKVKKRVKGKVSCIRKRHHHKHRRRHRHHR